MGTQEVAIGQNMHIKFILKKKQQDYVDITYLVRDVLYLYICVLVHMHGCFFDLVMIFVSG